MLGTVFPGTLYMPILPSAAVAHIAKFMYKNIRKKRKERKVILE